ncbi:hypothetical protein HYW87_03570 [Candidatus Roizmanbacteria bacterium]|nr:hypothetical protein [Candidatus Roizmanbacteria bacterium]
MQIIHISTKELRTKFPSIKKDLSRGIHFILIYRSKPLATIVPFESKNKKTKWPIDKIVGGFSFQKKIKRILISLYTSLTLTLLFTQRPQNY